MKILDFINEKVNDKLFYQGYEKNKSILDGNIILVASAGYVGYGSRPGYKSTQFRIVAKTAKGAEIGWVNFENKDDKLEALDLTIQPQYRRQGIATEMYKFARELGNDISPSKLQTTMGKAFWSKKDHSHDIEEGKLKNLQIDREFDNAHKKKEFAVMVNGKLWRKQGVVVKFKDYTTARNAADKITARCNITTQILPM